jgi:transmembrane sensor
MSVNSSLPNVCIDEAITWIARLRAHDVSPEDRSRFAEWLARDVRHSAAFDEIVQLWQRLGVVAHLTGAHGARIAPTQTLRFGKTSAALASLTVAATLAFSGLHDSDEFETPQGAQRAVVLHDGSKVLLNSDTRIDVDMAAHERRVTLRRGEAYFDVAMDRRRPFVVAGPRCTATALGTAFAVRVQPHHDVVIATKGAVRVVAGKHSIDVGENEEAIVTDDVATAPVDAAAQTAWRKAP